MAIKNIYFFSPNRTSDNVFYAEMNIQYCREISVLKSHLHSYSPLYTADLWSKRMFSNVKVISNRQLHTSLVPKPLAFHHQTNYLQSIITRNWLTLSILVNTSTANNIATTLGNTLPFIIFYNSGDSVIMKSK